jgi:PAS domain S-box-containing protein
MAISAQMRRVLAQKTPPGDAALLQALKTSEVPAWIFEQETLRFVEVNESALSRYGYKRDEFLTLTVLDIRPTSDIPTFLHTALLAPHSSVSPERWHHQTKSGEVFEVEIHSRETTFRGRQAEIVLAMPIMASACSEPGR